MEDHRGVSERPDTAIITHTGVFFYVAWLGVSSGLCQLAETILD